VRGALLLFLILTAATAGSQVYYRSDALGLRGTRISEAEREQIEWVLAVEEQDRLRRETLYRNNDAVQVLTVLQDAEGREERIVVDGLLARVERYNNSGDLVEERRYSGGNLVIRYEYGYTRGRLVSQQTFDADDELLLEERFHYWRDGSLRLVDEIDTDKRLLYRYNEGALTSEERVFDGFREELEFDEFGRVVSRTLSADGGVLEREERIYFGDPPAGLQERTITRAGETRSEQYGPDGELREADERADGRLTRNVERVFENGRLIEEREQRSGALWRTEYDYNEDALVEQRRYEDDELNVRIMYDPDGAARRTEIIYRDGAALLEVDYDGEQRIEERVLQDGEVVRVRRFGREQTE
jgi:antitoxin component YwqK of YwqJK toxin-antitoxin module